MSEKVKNIGQYRYYDIVMALFVTILLLSNLLSSAKIIDTGILLEPFPFIGSLAILFDAGTLVFPISYIFGDILTEVYGYKRSRRVIWMGFAATILMGFFVWLAGIMPGEAEWQGYAGQGAYDAILGGISGLIVASLLAYWAGEFSNSYVLAKMKIATKGRWLWLRTIGSTLVGQSFDTIIFFVVATLLGVFPVEILVPLIITNYIFKVCIEVFFTPITLMVVRFLKRAESEDYYDHETKFNPFRLEV